MPFSEIDAFEVDERIEVLERVGRGGIGRIVGGHVNGLHGRDGTAGRVEVMRS